MWLSGLYQLPPFLGDSTVGMIKIFPMITSKPAYLSVWEDVGDLCSRSNFLLHKNIDCKKNTMWYQNSNYFVFIHFSVFFSDVANFSGLILFLQFIDIRLAVLGNVDAGKSTLLGVLTHDELDNGRGRARLNLFRHLHEIQSGRTSSISHEILGFNGKGEVLHRKILHST